MFRRIIDLSTILDRKSCFLFGARQSGKTTFLAHAYEDAIRIDLLNASIRNELALEPHRLKGMLLAASRNNVGASSLVVIDEIQKIPDLLDEVHRLLNQNKAYRFILTGSSARKIRRAGVNLLGGRASRVSFFPLTDPERRSMNIEWPQALRMGSLPSILLSPDPKSDLLDYVELYIRDEIQNEAATRNVPRFYRFLKIASTVHAEQLVYSSLSGEVGVSSTTVKEYFQILEDTLIGFRLPPFRGGKKRIAESAPKFYFFDNGVAHALLNRWDVAEHTTEYGSSLESLILHELRAFIAYLFRRETEIYYWRSQSKFEVDFVLQNALAELTLIEVKSSKRLSAKHFKGIRKLAEDEMLTIKKKILVCNEPTSRMVDDILVLPVQEFLDTLWAGDVI